MKSEASHRVGMFQSNSKRASSSLAKTACPVGSSRAVYRLMLNIGSTIAWRSVLLAAWAGSRGLMVREMKE
jgi:hypothetical protein